MVRIARLVRLARQRAPIAVAALLAILPHIGSAQSALIGPTSVTVTNVNTRVVGTTTISSSSRLTVAWVAPTGYTVDHYEIRAVEAGLTTQVNATASQTSVTLTGLKASTTYTITVRSCQDAGCAAYGDATAVSGTTSAEYWQVQGTGASLTTATKVVAPTGGSTIGNVMPWPIRYGTEAGSSLAGKVRLYFRGGGFNVGLALGGTSTAAPGSVSSFTQDANYGLRAPTPATTFISSTISPGPTGVPRSVGGAQNIRLFFKGEGADNKSRVFYLDSQDGLAGQDFHPGTPTIVSANADWAVGGAAAPTIIIGVKGDATFGDSGLLQARQFKIGVPLLTSWLWDEAVGTFMVITGQDDCGQTIDGLFYVRWDGTRWNVVRDASNCARPLVRYAHGPVVLHRGDARYKLYYEDRLTDMGEVNKPLRMIYGDGALTGESSLEFEDWEAAAAAREVHFLWPDGSLVGVTDESGFGDHAIFYPTADPDVQFMYINLTGSDGTVPQASIGIGMAVLINDMCSDYATATRTVNECAPGITTHPSNTTTSTSATATLSVAATGSPTPAYQWQVSTNSGTTWTSLQNTAPYSGVTTPTLRVTRPTGGLSGSQYRAVATNAGGSATSTAATLTVTGTMTATPAAMRFGATISGATLQAVTSAQTVSVIFDGAASAWTAASNQPWLQLTGASGSASGTFTAQVVPGAVPAGSTSLAATITVTPASATTSAVALPVTLTVVAATLATVPIGAFDTPAGGAGVAGSIPVTGWALDDIEVAGVEIWRDRVAGETTPAYTGGGPGNGKVFIANAFFVNGARPDVETAYAVYPLAHRAGWGYLLLTQGLWNQGNGTYTLYAFAFDREGRNTTLGSKTITVSNATATKPFGALDVPANGETKSGSFYNFGWALTPKPNSTDARSCTITNGNVSVGIDSGALLPVSYGDARADIAQAFPGFSNTSNPSGAYLIDTTTLSNGMHQIGWYVVDNCGRAEGIGSRFFTVLNSGTTIVATDSRAADPRATGTTTGASTAAAASAGAGAPIEIRRGGEATLVHPSLSGRRVVAIGQGERVDVHLPAIDGARYEGYQIVNGERRALPIGSSLDAAQGIFYWEPAAGFLGGHDLEFIGAQGGVVRVRAVVGTSVQMAIDTPRPGAVSSSLAVEGWAIDEAATRGTGIDAVHVWAYPAGGGAPLFLGVAEYGEARPDIGALFGNQFAGASFRLVVPHLPAGIYDIVVYPRSAVVGDFHGAKAVRVRVPQ